MQSGVPSRTAWAAATHRAAHQILEEGRIFSDPLAVRILGENPEVIARDAKEHPSRTRMRLFIVIRTRFAEDALAIAVERGVRQLVILGAGLDTYAYRSDLGYRLRIFEVDYPATQLWKQEHLARAAIPVPNCLTFAPVDFEKQSLADGLVAAGFDPAQQTFFTWLGVVPYLTEQATWATLAFIAGLSQGAHVVFDYSDPPDSLSPEIRLIHDKRAACVAALGEAWVNYFEPDKLHACLIALGFADLEDLGPPQIVARYFPGHITAAPGKGGHIVCASTLPASHKGVSSKHPVSSATHRTA